MHVRAVYDGGSLFPPDILDITEDDLFKKFAMVISCHPVNNFELCVYYWPLCACM